MKGRQCKALDEQVPKDEIGRYEHRVRTVLAGMPAGIIVAEVESGRFVFANDTMCRMLGYEEGECLGLKVEDLHPDEEVPRARREFERLVSGEASMASDLLVERKDGSVFPADFRGALIELDGRRSLLGLVTDISERKRAEEALRESEVRTRTILQAIPDLMFIHDREGCYLDHHAADDALLAFSPEELMKKTVRDVFSEEMAEEVFHKFERAHETGETQVVEYSLGVQAGERHFEARITPMDEERQLTIVRDVTERKLAEESRRRLRALEGLGTAAGGIAHDFNNLLMGVFGNIEVAKRDLPEGHPAHSSIQAAHKALDQARQLTTRLLTFARGGDPVLETVDLRRRIAETVEFNLAGSNVALCIDLPDDLWPVKADRGQIVEVISNLTINSREAMEEGGTLHVLAENVADVSEPTAPHLSGDYVKLTIRDEGPGIPPEVARRVFDPYFTTKPGGSGLGLAIVHSIISRHEGHVGLDTSEGLGAAFTVYLPADLTAETKAEPRPSSPTPEAATRSSGRILVMDDEEMIRNMVSLMLEQLGHTAETAAHGEEAIEKYAAAMERGSGFDLTIMDLTVPGGMGGKDAVKELLALDPAAKVIVASGYSADPILSECEKHGFSGCIAKPFDLKELDDAVSRVLKKE